MIDRIDEQRAKGFSINDAIIEAALSRARPIIMTTVTTVFGLIPLAIFGGEFWYGMAIVIMCGLGVGTLLTFSFVPVLYSLFFEGFSFSIKRKAVPQKTQPEPHEGTSNNQEK